MNSSNLVFHAQGYNELQYHTPSIAFRHLPPDSAEGTLYLRASVQRRGQRPPKGSGTNKTVEAT